MSVINTFFSLNDRKEFELLCMNCSALTDILTLSAGGTFVCVI